MATNIFETFLFLNKMYNLFKNAYFLLVLTIPNTDTHVTKLVYNLTRKMNSEIYS